MTAYGRDVRAKVEIDWNGDNTYTDESGYTLNLSGNHRLAPPEESILSTQGKIARCLITLRNNDNRFSPLGGVGISGDISAGQYMHRGARVSISVDGGSTYERVFTGVMRNLSQRTIHPNNDPVVILDCRGREEEYINDRQSSSQASFASAYDSGKTESGYISDFLDSGISSGDIALDAGMFNIPFGWMDDDSPIETMWQLASAAGGRFYFDRGGTARYERLDHWLYSPHDTSQRTFTRGTAEYGYSSLSLAFDTRELTKNVTVEFTARHIDALTTVWEPDEPITIPPGEIVVAGGLFSAPVYTAPTWSYTATTYGGEDITSDVTIGPVAGPQAPRDGVFTYAQRKRSYVYNGHATETAILKQVTLTARPVTNDYTGAITVSSDDSFWTGRTELSRRVRGNRFLQTEAQASTLSGFLVDRLDNPRITFNLQGCPGDPSLDLGDRITVSDSISISSDKEAFVTGITWRFSGEFSQDVEAIDATNYYAYGTADYFIIGTDTLADPSDRLFY